jgi:V/A-type H+-transporting ATPase subunit I
MQRWLTEKLPLLVLAVAIPVLFLHPAAGLTLMLMALLITVLTAGKQSGYKGALTGVLKLVEDGIQLAMNMLSFIRLGAFTLAHGGLSAAVMVLTMMPDNLLLRLLIFVAGNALVIALEGLVVSIQTTRLVMFEFFRRFLQGTGRPFKPLTDPAMS